MDRRHDILILFVTIIFMLSACQIDEVQKQDKAAQVPADSVDIRLSMWLVDWLHEESVADVSETIDGIDHLLLFGTYFDEHGELYEIDQTSELIERVLEDAVLQQKEVYITIVNDQFTADGTIIQKNPELLDRLLASSASRQAHIEEIVQYAKSYPIDGIEIDYEKSAPDLIDEYILFMQDLKQALEEENLALRIVLEPSFPIDTNPLPEGLQYVVMAYNLYGFHSGPGPKADYDFLDQLSERFPNDHGNVNIALATGGFAWQADKVEQLTNEQIAEILQHHSIEPIRDEASGALTFVYEEDGEAIEVWFADAMTMALWCERLIDHGYTQFSIWRAGGLTEDLLHFFTIYSNK